MTARPAAVGRECELAHRETVASRSTPLSSGIHPETAIGGLACPMTAWGRLRKMTANAARIGTWRRTSHLDDEAALGSRIFVRSDACSAPPNSRSIGEVEFASIVWACPHFGQANALTHCRPNRKGGEPQSGVGRTSRYSAPRNLHIRYLTPAQFAQAHDEKQQFLTRTLTAVRTNTGRRSTTLLFVQQPRLPKAALPQYMVRFAVYGALISNRRSEEGRSTSYECLVAPQSLIHLQGTNDRKFLGL